VPDENPVHQNSSPRGDDIARQMGSNTEYNKRKNVPGKIRVIDDAEEEGERATDPAQ
ncbi:hypothetical protein HDU93_004370, partial [Gonapodya sp. JEL0774]